MVELFKFHKLEKVPLFIEEQLSQFRLDLNVNESFQQKIYPLDFEKYFNDNITDYLKSIIQDENVIFSDRACLNFVKNTGIFNRMDWHNENGIKNGIKDQVILHTDYDCILWLEGDKNKGGALKIIHDLTGDLLYYDFDPPGFVLITKDTLHSVENYYGENYRVSFNIDFNLL